MNDLQIFNNEEFGSVRTTEINGEIYFVGKDVAEALGYANASKAIADHVDDEDKLNNDSLLSLGQRGGWIINESGLYSLVLSSKLPSAKKFKRWITSEVIPSLRKNGAYLTDEKALDIVTDPSNLIGLLEQAAQQLKQKDIRIAEMRPKEIFADAVTCAETSILVRDLSKLARQNGVDIGEKRLWKWLRNNGYIIKGTTEPTQYAMERGWFERVVRTVQRGSDTPIETITTKVTGKGQVYFINKLLGE